MSDRTKRFPSICLALAAVGQPQTVSAQQAMPAQENPGFDQEAFARRSAGRSGFFDETLANVVGTDEGSVYGEPAQQKRGVQAATTSPQSQAQEQSVSQNSYVGMWVTEDGCIRQELLPNGRYDEARGARQHAYQGRYEIDGSRVNYWDDTGFTADGEFVDENTLHHGGMIFRRVVDRDANPCDQHG